MKKNTDKQKITRRQRQRQQQRQDIINAALDLFAERGFANVSMQEIATASEFAVGTLYNAFKNKEALYREIIHSHAQAIFKELMLEIDLPGSAEQRLRNLLRRHRTVFLNHAQAIRLYLSEATGFGALSRDEEVHRLWQAGVDKIAGIIEAGMAEGVFRPLPARSVTLALAGALENLVFAEIDKHEQMDNAEETLETLLLQGLLAERVP